MPVITQIRRNVKNAQRCSIFIDDAFYVSCHVDVATSLGIRIGMELTSEIEASLRTQDKLIVFKQKIYSFAVYKPRTEAQVRDKLRSYELDDSTISSLLNWLREFTLIGDAQYIRSFVATSQLRKPMSPLALRTALRKKGIEDAMIQQTLAEMIEPEDVMSAAIAVAEKKNRMLKPELDPKRRKEKVTSFLRMRGFDWDVIRKVVNDLLPIVMVMMMAHAVSDAQQKGVCERNKMSDAINRYQPTTQPVLSPDGKTLYLDRKLHPQNTDGPSDPDDVWVSQLVNGRWSEPEHVELTTRVRQPDIIFNLTSDGLCALVVGKYGLFDTLPSFACLYRKTPIAKFDSVRPIDLGPLGSNYYGHISDDRRTLMVALVREGGNGDMDMYHAELCDDLLRPELHTLGSLLNTKGFDGSPWLAHDMKTLYFASNGRGDKKGRSDIYLTSRKGNSWTEWTEPVNLGPCFNTVQDETSISLSPLQDTAYVTSWSPETGRQAIYMIKMSAHQKPGNHVWFTARISDAITKEKIPYSVLHIEDSLGCHYALTSDTTTGMVHAAIRQRVGLKMFSIAPRYVGRDQKLNIRGLDSVSKLNITIRLFPVERPLLSIYFDRGSAQITEQQKHLLDSLVQLSEIRDISLMVQGYTDIVGSASINKTLSVERAQAVRNAMIQLGLDTRKLVAEGLGVELITTSGDYVENPESRRVDIFVR